MVKTVVHRPVHFCEKPIFGSLPIADETAALMRIK
jgi:hypothetical protein